MLYVEWPPVLLCRPAVTGGPCLTSQPQNIASKVDSKQFSHTWPSWRPIDRVSTRPSSRRRRGLCRRRWEVTNMGRHFIGSGKTSSKEWALSSVHRLDMRTCKIHQNNEWRILISFLAIFGLVITLGLSTCMQSPKLSYLSGQPTRTDCLDCSQEETIVTGRDFC